ncbi:hypothetical protein STHAL_05765 [Streptomyces halstedii]|uniref:MFS transporter n=1 Tax=Streptomyces halstedii TaxID=1944 RepID=A0ABS6TLI9_STRHA|nr:hypothetical protein [Streptomyces halstedii]MBV7668999.1 hypothetical protein [Streptomyces halstedii]
MPRLSAAQVFYGSATVVLSALAMLLLSRTDSGAGVAVIGAAALVLGLLVAVTVTVPRPGRARALRTAGASGTARAPHRVEAVRTPARAHRAGDHSLHR